MVWRFKSCSKCGGDLAQEEDDWRCWQCGRYRFSRLSRTVDIPQPEPDLPVWAGAPHRVRGPRRRGYGGKVGRNINAVVEARQTSDDRWLARNRDVIAYLDEGLKVQEVAVLTSKGQRQIRVVRERLADLRMGAPLSPSNFRRRTS